MSATRSVLKRPSAFIPLVMSLLALCLILAHVAISGTAPQPDEGLEAHLWQLLMAGQIPVIVFFLVVWLPRDRKAVIPVVALQAIAAVAAAAPVLVLGW